MGEAHTPGPWSHHLDFDCPCDGISSRDHPIATVVRGDWGDGTDLQRLWVRTLHQFFGHGPRGFFCYGHVDRATAQANTRLIAAAPDLLAAVKALVEAYGEPNAADRPRLETAQMTAARAAIALAEGRKREEV